MVVRINTQTAQSLLVPRPALIDISAFFGITGSPILSADADVVGGELFNVMSTLIGDDQMNPTYGCNLPRRVFEQMTAALEQLCLQDVIFAAEEWVPQVKVSMQQTVVYASSSNRLIGVGVAYQYAGGGWFQPVTLAQGLSAFPN